MINKLKKLTLVIILSNFCINGVFAAKNHENHNTPKKVKSSHKKPANKAKLTKKKKSTIQSVNAKHKKKQQITQLAKKSKNKNIMVGIASYYGSDFHGQRMANGRVFNSQDTNTAAHSYLPLGTKLQVTNLSNGRTIYVEVRDRMGNKRRAIDLSEAGAKYLGMHRKGLTKVKLVKISNEKFHESKRHLEIEDEDSGLPG